MTPSSSPRRPPKVPRPDPVRVVESPAVAAVSGDPVAAEALWRSRFGAGPLVEPSGRAGWSHVTFLWRDAHAAAVLVFINRVTDETRLEASLMRRVPGTDLWALGYEMADDWRAGYAFLVQGEGTPAPWLPDGPEGQIAIRAALDRGQPDPTNPAQVRNRAGSVQSVVALPAAPPQPWLVRPVGAPIGSLEECRTPNGARFWWYRGPGAPSPHRPLLLVADGEVWTSSQDLPATLDALAATGVLPPVDAVLLDSGGRDQRWQTMGETDRDLAAELYVDELLPWAVAQRGAPVAADRVVALGQSLGGLTALRIGVRRPDLVGAVLAQSASLWLEDPAEGSSRLDGLRVELQVGRQEWVLTEPHAACRDRLAAAGAEVGLRDINGGHDYAWWRGSIADGLVALLGGGPRNTT